MLENVEQIRREIPAEFSLVPPDGGDVKTYEAVRTMADEITRLRAENEALREALGGLLKGVSDDPEMPDHYFTNALVSYGQVRRARAAYEGGEQFAKSTKNSLKRKKPRPFC